MKTDIIGTGPIYIKKSTEYSSAKKPFKQVAETSSDITFMTMNTKTIQPRKKTKIHAIQENNLYVRQDSELTTGTEKTYIPIQASGPKTKKQTSVVPPKGQIKSFATMVEQKRYSQPPDNVSVVSSQLTQLHDQYVSFRSPRGLENQVSSYDKKKRESEDTYSTLTGNTYLVGGPYEKAHKLQTSPARFAAEYESHRSSMETVVAKNKLPGHIGKGQRTASQKVGSSPAKKKQKSVSMTRKANGSSPHTQSMKRPPVNVLNGSQNANLYVQQKNTVN